MFWITLIIIARRDGRHPGHVRLPDPAGAEDRRLDAGPHRPQPRRPVGPAPADRRRPQVPLQGRHHPRARRQAVLPPRPGRVADGRPAGLRRRAVRPHGGAADPAGQRLAANRPGPGEARRRPDVPAQPGGLQRQPHRAISTTVQFVIAPHVDIGIVFVFAVGSLAVYAIILGGWSSNNKYSFLGALRSSAQLISYEIPLGMSVLGVLLVTGSLNLERIIDYQYDHGWNILFQPLAFLLFVDQHLRRVQSSAVRPAGGGAGTGRRLPHRVQRA